MSEQNDALKAFQPKPGVFLTVKSGKENAVKLKVLTTDPVVHADKYGNTRYAFIVWNITDEVPQVLDKGYSVFSRIRDLDIDPDFGTDVRKLDLKLSATGEGKETRYAVDVLQTKTELTNPQIKEAAKLNLDTIISNGIRLSQHNEGQEVPTFPIEDESAVKEEETEIEEVGDEPVNLDDIPF